VVGCGGPQEPSVVTVPAGDSVVTPRPIAVEWADSLCRTLDPVFDALRVPLAAAEPGPDPRVLLDQARTAQVALELVDDEMPAVGPPPSTEAMAVTERVDDRLEALRLELAAAASQLEAALGTDPTGVEPAAAEVRSVLRSFDRDAIPAMLEADPALANAPAFAPACMGAPVVRDGG
jgi:hypothetical protein